MEKRKQGGKFQRKQKGRKINGKENWIIGRKDGWRSNGKEHWIIGRKEAKQGGKDR